MELHAKLVRSQLSFFKPFVAGLSLEVTRKGQDKLGELMTALHRREVLVRDHDFGAFQGAWVMPKDQRRSGVILYLHGGGYTCGSLEYAKGFAATLASECGVRVFCPAYRLAPEHPYPAALDDALESYQYLLKKGYEPRQILLAGESAGGGLIYCLCLRLKQLGMALPCGLVGISPWTDLTGSGDSYRDNREKDPSMTPELLQFYAKCYTQDPTDPLCSPLFGDLTGLPPSLLFVGGDEVMLDDTRACITGFCPPDAAASCTLPRSGGTPMCCTASMRTWLRTSRTSTTSWTGPCPRPGACGGCGWTTPPRSILPPSAGTGTTSFACPSP